MGQAICIKLHAMLRPVGSLCGQREGAGGGEGREGGRAKGEGGRRGRGGTGRNGMTVHGSAGIIMGWVRTALKHCCLGGDGRAGWDSACWGLQPPEG